MGIETFIEPTREAWPQLIQRPQFETGSLRNRVEAILREVKADGDEAIRRFSIRFDQAELDALTVSEAEVQEAGRCLGEDLKAAILMAKQNIERFHQSQVEPELQIETMPGIVCSRKSLPIEKVGLYIPGGSAPLFSTVLMLAIPAKIAGCSEIVLCTPAGKGGVVHPAILYTAAICGVTKIFKAGGAQAIGAMAYGTETIPAVHKIFGPGNQYVTCAKQMVHESGTAIDMPAGPSEVAVYADGTCHAAFVAADLLSQAEHGPDSQVMLIASAPEVVGRVEAALEEQLSALSRKHIAAESLRNSRAIVLKDTSTAFDFINEYAPEHLIIATENAREHAHRVKNAGSVFLGPYSAESIGDYASGTNHTLPTYGYAKAYSGVSIDSFIKKITFQEVTSAGLNNIGKAVECMALAEGLDAHARAVTIRLKTLS